jgi:hypothetical protein
MTSSAYDYEHVRPEMRQFLEIEGATRLSQSWHRIWVNTPSTKDAFDQLKLCMDDGPSTKPRGITITGEANSGKSRVMKQFCAENPPFMDPETEYATHPAVCILAPDTPDRIEIYKSILAEIGQPILYNAKATDLRRYTINMIRSCKVKTILIDELHDISRQRMSDQTVEFLRFLKGLVNATGRPFVVSGVPLVLDLLLSDEQIEGRFETLVRMRPLGKTDFVKAVLAFEKQIPLRRPSNFRQDESILQFIWTFSEGYIGKISNLLKDASRVAIESREERITLEILQKLPDKSIRSASLLTT